MSAEATFAPHLERLRTYWPQAWISDVADGNGMRLIALPGFRLPPGWTHNICTVLWLARPSANDDHMHSPLRGFFVDLIDLELTERPWHPQCSRGGRTIHGEVVHLYAPWEHWRELTWFGWKQQMWDPNRDNIMTHVGMIRHRLNPAR